MRLGTRWRVGDPPAAGLPDAVLRALAAVERELNDEGVDASDWRWTLTWLEGRPVLELDDGTTIVYDPNTDSTVISGPPEEDD